MTAEYPISLLNARVMFLLAMTYIALFVAVVFEKSCLPS